MHRAWAAAAGEHIRLENMLILHGLKPLKSCPSARSGWRMSRQPWANQGMTLCRGAGREEAHACRVRMRSAAGFRVRVGGLYRFLLGRPELATGVPGLRYHGMGAWPSFCAGAGKSRPGCRPGSCAVRLVGLTSVLCGTWRWPCGTRPGLHAPAHARGDSEPASR